MLALLGMSTIASLVASSVIGARLLRLAARTRELPELLMGAAFISAGVIGYTLMLSGTIAKEAIAPDAADLLFMAGFWLISGGVILTYCFVWRVFHPSSTLAMVCVAVVSLVVLVTALPIAVPSLQQTGAGAMASFLVWLGNAARIGCGAWGTVEAVRYAIVLRRRLRLGLADPVVVNRIMLWGVSSFGGVVIFASTAVASAGGPEGVMGVGQVILISTVTFGVAFCQWLAFLPPQRYLAWVSEHGAGRLTP